MGEFPLPAAHGLKALLKPDQLDSNAKPGFSGNLHSKDRLEKHMADEKPPNNPASEPAPSGLHIYPRNIQVFILPAASEGADQNLPLGSAAATGVVSSPPRQRGL